jgi:hypothetical protein
MGVVGPYEVDARRQFPCGLGLLSEVAPVLEYDEKRPKSEWRQERDKESGLPLWFADLLDFEPGAREHTFRVKFAAAVQPVPPPAVEGMLVRPVQLEGLRISCYTKVTGRNREGKDIVRVAQTVTASGFAQPGKPGDGSKAAER